MCGLTGYARHPKGDLPLTARSLFADLLHRTESRGTHATGMAAWRADGARHIRKTAVRATEAMKSTPWQESLNALDGQTMCVIGHTRYATQPNKHLDEAAHPFVVGKVVGAHNGIIYNWRELHKELEWKKEWIVDSQAAFGALHKEDEPLNALRKLEGYFALTWVKNQRLFLCRSDAAPLSVAYVPSMRAMFWNSEKGVLRDALALAGIKATEYQMWEAEANCLYEYDPMKFTVEGTKALKVRAKDKWGGGGRRPTAAELARTSGGRGGSWDPYAPPFTQPYSDGAEGFLRAGRTDNGYALTRAPMTSAALELAVKRMEVSMADLKSENERLSAELEHLYRALNHHGLLDALPPAPAPAKDPTQGDLLAGMVGVATGTPCVVCRRAGADAYDADGRPIHYDCILSTEDEHATV